MEGPAEMRVLFTTWAWPSHLYSLVPLAWACHTAGHEVLVASQPSLTAEIVRCGLPAASVGHDVDAVGFVREYLLSSVGERKPGAAKGPRAMEMLHAHANSMTGGLIAVAKDFRPDIVVYEPTALAGPLAAAAIGVPAVRHLYGTDLLLRAGPLLQDLLAPLASLHGITEFEPLGAVTVDPTPPSLRLPTTLNTVGVRYLPFNGGAAAPDPLPASRRPRVLVTWGHTMARLGAGSFLLPRVVDAVHELGFDVVAAVSTSQKPLLGSTPDGVRVLVDTPLSEVVGHCDLVIAHGGAGTVLTALRNGVPLLLVPQLPDHAGHAARVAAIGAGELLPHEDLNPARLREETERLLGEPGFREQALALREEMLEQQPPAALAADPSKLLA